MMAAFALGLLVNAALAVWLPAEIHFWKSLKPVTFEPVTFESVSSNGMHVYAAEFGYGYVDLDFAALGPGGKTAVQSFHMRY
jgi:hypothetical protein